jgi:hypothetical protein
MGFIGYIMKKTLFIILILCTHSLHAWSLFHTDYSKLSPQERISRLQEDQVQDPNNPEVNYNLGVALYKEKRIGDAKPNFARALEHVSKNIDLKKRCLFNLGTICFKQTQAMLPPNWEKEDAQIDQQLLAQAIAEIKQSIDYYKTLLEIEPENEKAKKGLNLAQWLLKKLEKKQQEQQQNNQQQDNKNQQSQPNEQSSSGDQKQDQDQSMGKSQVKQDQKEGDQNKRERQGEKSPEHLNNGAQERENNKLGQDQNKDKEQEKINKDTHNSPQDKNPQPSTTEGTQGGKETQENQPESMEMRGLRAMLEDLQADETKTQKNVLLRKIAEQQPEQRDNQKPW